TPLGARPNRRTNRLARPVLGYGRLSRRATGEPDGWLPLRCVPASAGEAEDRTRLIGGLALPNPQLDCGRRQTASVGPLYEYADQGVGAKAIPLGDRSGCGRIAAGDRDLGVVPNGFVRRWLHRRGICTSCDAAARDSIS